MRYLFLLALICSLGVLPLTAQTPVGPQPLKPRKPIIEDINAIDKHIQIGEEEKTDPQATYKDDEQAMYNRWKSMAGIRAYPSGKLPRPGALMQAYYNQKNNGHETRGATNWSPVGPINVPTNFNGIGRVNCIVIDPKDTNTLYIGTACGGMFVSHDEGSTWATHSDDFPSLSVADIAVNPKHTDTLYIATGDGYGYNIGGYEGFWGGLYSAGVLKSTDNGKTWDSTGLKYGQAAGEIIQRLLIHPLKTNMLLAATRQGIFRSIDAGVNWKLVDSFHVYDMEFKPNQPDTIYAINDVDLRVSYNAGATWHTLHAGINKYSRGSIAVSPAMPNGIWVLASNDTLYISYDQGHTFGIKNDTNKLRNSYYYGYYDRVLSVSPKDAGKIMAWGAFMGTSPDSGTSWTRLDPTYIIHLDNHACTFNPLNANTFYSGNDGGIFVTHDGGGTWTNISNGLMISQIYRLSASVQHPNTLICGVQDNGTFEYDGANWYERIGADGEANAICAADDRYMIGSSQYGSFYLSKNMGSTYSFLGYTCYGSDWTSPVLFNPHSPDTIYFGCSHVYSSYDKGATFNLMSIGTDTFVNNVKNMVMAPSNTKVLYAADYANIYMTRDGGLTWNKVTGNLPMSSVAISRIAVDPTHPLRVYVTTSGYVAGNKLFVSDSGGGGTSWNNISGNLPNLPANCMAIDTSTKGALFVGTDIGVYYRDDAHPAWSVYSHGLPNVIVNDLVVSYDINKVRAATYGRGVWESHLMTSRTLVNDINNSVNNVQVYPNPATNSWHIDFKYKPIAYQIEVRDIIGRQLMSKNNTPDIDASALPGGVYILYITAGDRHYAIKAVKE